MKSSKITAVVLAGIAGVAVLTLSACSSDPEPAPPVAPVSSAPATDVPATDAPATDVPTTDAPASPSDVPATTDGSTTPSDSASPSDDMMDPVTTPILVELDAIPDPATALAPIDVATGQAIVFNSMTPEGWVVAATPEGVVKVSQGGKEGDAILNPGAIGQAAGTATITVTSATDPAKVYTFIVNVK